MKKFNYLLLLLLLVIPFLAEAKITVHGSVLTSKGKTPIVGAIIRDQTNDITTSSDVDGNFTISVDEGATISVSAIGYKPKNVKVKSENTIVYLSTSNDVGRHRFFSLTGGIMSVRHSFKDNMDLGLMGGSYWKNWGVYGRLSIPIAFSNSQREGKVGIVGTVGAIRNLTENVRLFAGTGFGFCLNGYDLDYAYPVGPGGYYPGGYYPNYSMDDNSFEWDTESPGCLGVPFEVGCQWNIGHINMLAGVQYMMNIQEPSAYYRCNLKIFLGVGYTF
ncbi:MAG: carboxypeptidase-like regulatory domain-containing protein [Muribaculaceae bacterium]|nr:carboxypeptidase-like regulatory domain-containing protein [Muribaculaceae bacterium]